MYLIKCRRSIKPNFLVASNKSHKKFNIELYVKDIEVRSSK